MRLAASRVVCTLLLAAAGGCRTPPPPVPVPVAPPPDDSAADWHGLVLAPFGSVLKDVPAPLHEVLLFRDDAPGAAVDAECYSTDSAAPPLLGRMPDDYLICFNHDRLSRIEASVHLTAAEAPDVFAQACGAWLRHAATSGTAATAAAPGGSATTTEASTRAPASMAPTSAAPARVAPTAPPPAGPAATSAAPLGPDCEGRDGAVHFVGHLAEEPGADGGPEHILSLRLDSPDL